MEAVRYANPTDFKKFIKIGEIKDWDEVLKKQKIILDYRFPVDGLAEARKHGGIWRIPDPPKTFEALLESSADWPLSRNTHNTCTDYFMEWMSLRTASNDGIAVWKKLGRSS